MLKFYKMHGIGNDYVYIDCLSGEIRDPAPLAVKLSDRHFGIGSDGLILIRPSDTADCFMDIYNADGSLGKMCGNGIRCVARYLHDHGIIRGTDAVIDTRSGIRHLRLNLHEGKVESVTVDMGRPGLQPSDIPVQGRGSSPIIAERISAGSFSPEITCVSMGNPHTVIFVDNTESAPVEELGKIIENHPMFPERTNAEFVEALDRETIRMRVWERGSGETLACGTGACASAVAAVLTGRTGRDVLVKLRGGDLQIHWDAGTDRVLMTGPATPVFYGYIEDELTGGDLLIQDTAK